MNAIPAIRQAIFEVSGDVAQLHDRFGGLEAKVLRLQARLSRAFDFLVRLSPKLTW